MVIRATASLMIGATSVIEKSEAVKMVRKLTDLDLLEAKEYVDQL